MSANAPVSTFPRSGACTGLPGERVLAGPLPIVNCSSSRAAIRSLETHSCPDCPPPITVIPAPETSNTSTHASHRLAGGDLVRRESYGNADRLLGVQPGRTDPATTARNPISCLFRHRADGRVRTESGAVDVRCTLPGARRRAVTDGGRVRSLLVPRATCLLQTSAGHSTRRRRSEEWERSRPRLSARSTTRRR